MSTPESWELKERLLADWEKISAVVDVASGDPARALPLGLSLALSSPLPEESQRSIARRWVSIFDDEIRTVMLARNAVAHAKPISDESLKSVVGLADELLGTLGQRLTNGTETPAAAG
jgi:hypothetical protein